MSTDLTAHTATQLGLLYESKEASPVEVLEAVLGRIERIDPAINAFSLVAVDQARAAAAASEARWRRNESLGLLDGVPTSIKDVILTKGLPTRRGSRTVDVGGQWNIDAPATARLRAAGAVIIGKTTTPEFGCKLETNSPLTGITRNPWDLTKTAGGSSGGSAAAVSAGLGPLSIGTDAAGSVRVPAAFCGGVGFKPSFGRIPSYPPSVFGSLANVGVHSMSVADAALMADVLKQFDARDWLSLPADNFSYLDGWSGNFSGLRVAYSPTLGYADVHPDVARAVGAVADTLTEAGALVDVVNPGFEDPIDLITGLWYGAAWALWDNLSPEQRILTDPDFAAQAELGSRLSGLDIQKLALRRAEFGSHLRQFMERFDVILTPTVPDAAFEARPAGHERFSSEMLFGWTPFSYPFNLSHQPAITVPCGLTTDGLPIGAQFVAGVFDDALLFSVAAAYTELHPVLRPPI